jgi:cobalt-precorrin-5B (C1)-methyltransferase
MSKLASECVDSKEIIHEIRQANTARHVYEIINQHKIENFFNLICKYVYNEMYSHSNNSLEIIVIMFDFEGQICGKYP